jgi:hypothetical protein
MPTPGTYHPIKRCKAKDAKNEHYPGREELSTVQLLSSHEKIYELEKGESEDDQWYICQCASNCKG